MADVVIVQGQSVPAGLRFRFRDMSDGTHAPVWYIRTGVGASLNYLTPTMQTRYIDLGDGTHALVRARDG